MSLPPTSDDHVPVRRYQLDPVSGQLVPVPRKELFLKGPIPLSWLGAAAQLPGKTLNVAIALMWLHGMTNGKPVKLNRTALRILNVKRDAASASLNRLEKAGLVRVDRKPGQRPTVTVLEFREN